MTLTFLIPCYNAERYLQRCLDSILSGDIGDDVELLLVNDGSSDNTLSMLHQYERRHPENIRVIDKANGGWGSVVNMGVRLARGRYLKVVDADDMIDTSNLKTYLDTLRNNDVDCLVTGFTEVHESRRRTFSPHTNSVQRGSVAPIFILDDITNPAATFRTALLRDINLTIGDRYYSDIEFTTYPLPYLKKILTLPLTIYIYHRNNDGQSTSQNGYAAHYHDMNSLAFRMIAFYNSLPDGTQAACLRTIFDRIATTVEMSYKLMMSPEFAGRNENIKEELKSFDSKLKDLSPLFYRTMNKRKKHHIPYILFWRMTGINLLNSRNFVTGDR